MTDEITTARGRPRDPTLDAEVGLTLALERILGCSAAEAARLVAQADSALLDAAFRASPVDADRVLGAISSGLAARSTNDVDEEIAQVRAEAEREFPTNYSGVRSPDAERRLEARIRRLSAKASALVRDSHPAALRIEDRAGAILQGRKTRRANVGYDDMALVEALERALTREDDAILSARADATLADDEPWRFG